ncbi:sensor histidine kinase [Kribbella sp. NBC_00382]|uniref:sensor histidine kinase n=1 Tax=Kribbella sp. NBC_00382 TaxID=2975967 RepID=UPI002E225C14
MDNRAPLVTRLRPGQVLAVGIGLAAAYGGAAWVLFTHKSPQPVVSALGTLLTAVAIVLARRHTVWAFASAWVPLALMPVDSSLGFVAVLPLCYALFRVAGGCGRRTALILLAVAEAGALATVLPDGGAGAVVPFGMMFAAAWVTGYVAAQQRGHNRELVLQQERMRIARELHDIVAHSMSVITVQAGYGYLVIDERPDEARASLAAIESAGRQTLAELRQVLGVLRSAQDQPAALDPMPGLGQLEQLVEDTGRAGVKVRLTVTGRPVDVPAGIGLSAYRIVQEGLTNVVKHAATSGADALVEYRPTELAIRITDDGAGCPDGVVGTGHGLIGIRERVALYGGSLRAGPLPGRGFELSARLPLNGRPA